MSQSLPERVAQHPSIQRICDLAIALDDVNARVVYIGGAITPILLTEPPFRSLRVTKDVDAIAATASYSEHGSLQERMRALGFVESVDQGHAHRWRAANGILFDLVPASGHLGASGNAWDAYAVESAITVELKDGTQIRHASAPAFLALKWAAYRDRGAGDPWTSHDLEDILGLVASRPGVDAEIAGARIDVASYIRKGFAALASSPDYDELLAGFLGHAFDAPEAIATVKVRIAAIRALG